MIRSLRKGQTSIEIWYKYGADSIGAKQAEIELMDKRAIFRIRLSPVDKNQSHDADNIFIDNLETISKIIIWDEHIRKNTSKSINSHSEKISFVNLEIVYKKRHAFSSDLRPLDEDGLEFYIKNT